MFYCQKCETNKDEDENYGLCLDCAESWAAAVEKLTDLLIARDGGDHDVDCRFYRGRGCTCGHSSVQKYLTRDGV